MPPFRHNRFGFTLGGPVVIPKRVNGRNKLFFIVNYEGLGERKALIIPVTVPPQGWVAGNLSAVNGTIFDLFSRQLSPTGPVLSSTPLPGNIIPCNRIVPISTAHMTQWMPQMLGPAVAPNNFLNTEGRPTDANQQNARFDYTQSSNVNWFFRYHQVEFQYNPTSMPVPSTTSSSPVKPYAESSPLRPRHSCFRPSPVCPAKRQERSRSLPHIRLNPIKRRIPSPGV